MGVDEIEPGITLTFSKNRRAAAGGSDIAAKLFERGDGAAASEAALLSTDSFLGRWHADRSLGVDEGVFGRETDSRTTRRHPAAGGEPRGGFPWSEALERRRTPRRPILMLGCTARGRASEAKLCFMGHALMENRNGLVVDACLTEANGHAERIAALHMPSRAARRSVDGCHARRRQGLRHRGLRQ